MVRLQMGKPAFCGLAAAFLTILTTSPIYRQTLKGTILATITPSTQAVVSDVRVNLTETNANFHRTETTNDSGFNAFSQSRSGHVSDRCRATSVPEDGPSGDPLGCQ